VLAAKASLDPLRQQGDGPGVPERFAGIPLIARSAPSFARLWTPMIDPVVSEVGPL